MYACSVVMDCVYIGNFRVGHFGKRRLMGLEKAHALRSMMLESTDTSVYIRNKAQILMREGIICKLIYD